jgi:predicted dehydrogenase
MTIDGKVRVAVIGAGWYAAQNHIPVLARRDDVVLDGVSRLGPADLARVKDHFGFAFASEDFREVLARRPDAVVVASPHHLHYEHVAAALDQGAHVLCEKPMTLDPAEAWDLVARAKRAGRSLLIANGYHYLPGVPEFRNLIAEGAVGRIEHVMCSFISATRAVFEGEVGLARWQTTFFRPDRATWQDPARGGGFAYGQLSHSLAMLLWLTGLRPREIAAQVLAPGGVDLCDAAALVFDDGAVASISGAAAMPEGQRGLMRFFITGTEGVLEVEFDRDRAELRRHDGSHRQFEIAPSQWVYDCEGPPNALIDLAKGASENRSPGENGAATVAVIAALLESARDGGRPVGIEIPPERLGSSGQR